MKKHEKKDPRDLTKTKVQDRSTERFNIFISTKWPTFRRTCVFFRVKTWWKTCS